MKTNHSRLSWTSDKNITLWFIYISSMLCGSRTRLQGCKIGATCFQFVDLTVSIFLYQFLSKNNMFQFFIQRLPISEGGEWLSGKFFAVGLDEHSVWGEPWVMDWHGWWKFQADYIQSQMEFKAFTEGRHLPFYCLKHPAKILQRRKCCIFRTQSVSWLINWLNYQWNFDEIWVEYQ